MNGSYKEQPHDPGHLKRFAVGSEVRFKVTGKSGVIRQVGFQPNQLDEYWHSVEYLLPERLRHSHTHRRCRGCGPDARPRPALVVACSSAVGRVVMFAQRSVSDASLGLNRTT